MSERDTPPRNEKDDAKPAAALTDVKIGRRGLSGTPKTEAHTATPPAPADPAPSRATPEAVSRPRSFPAARLTTPLPVHSHEPAIIENDGTDRQTVAPAAIIDLWEHLAAERLRPRMRDMDPVAIARQWPNSLLLRVTNAGRRPGLEVAHMFAPTAGGPTAAIPIDAMTLDWIVGLGREVVSTGGPVHETDAVPTEGGPIDCGVIALPFGPEAGVDHVLCHLYRVNDRLIEGEATRVSPEHTPGRRFFGR